MASSPGTLARVVRVVVDRLGANVTEADFAGVSRLDEVVALDSIALLELSVGLEQEFQIRFDADRLDRAFLVDLAGLVKYLDDRAGIKPS